MAVLVISDSHGKIERVIETIEREKENIDSVFFLGDGINDIKMAEEMYPNLKFYYVLGNNDFFEEGSYEREILYNNYKIFLTHGHLYGKLLGEKKLINKCNEKGINIVFLGHTHTRREENKEDILFLNPGSIGRPFDGKPSYSVVEFNEGGINNIVKFLD